MSGIGRSFGKLAKEILPLNAMLRNLEDDDNNNDDDDYDNIAIITIIIISSLMPSFVSHNNTQFLAISGFILFYKKLSVTLQHNDSSKKF